MVCDRVRVTGVAGGLPMDADPGNADGITSDREFRGGREL
jgi:hypothetical protein